MFGAYRLILAILVVVTHIGHVEVIAGLAVWAFFMLSGFLITGVLNTRYGFGLPGLSGFAVSRILRLYPTYWLIALIAFAIIASYRVEIDPSLVNSAFQPLTEFRDWFSGIFIVGHTFAGLGRVERALSPPVWAVDVELWLYVISCVLVSRSRRAAKWAFLICLGLFPFLWVGAKTLIRMGEVDLGGQLIYSFLPAALLPYSIGAFLWFMRDKLAQVKATPLGLFIGGLGIVVLSLWVSRASVTAAYVLSLPIFGYLTISLSSVRSTPAMKRLDDLLGHMSYPMYLSHYLCAYVVIVISGRFGYLVHIAISDQNSMFSYTALGFFVITLAVLMFSLLIAMLLEQPMVRLRHNAARKLSMRLGPER